jgi:chemotaxis protein MotB
MNAVKFIFVMLMCTMVLGCLSQQAHERTMEELEMTHQSSVQEVERLQHIVQKKEASVVQLEEEKQAFEETLRVKDATLVQLQEANKELEAVIEVQEQVKEQQLEGLKKELQALYSQVIGLGSVAGTQPVNFSAGVGDDGVDLDDLTQAFRNVRSTLASQMSDFSQLRAQNGELEEEIKQMEMRLQHVEQLRQELEHVRAAREAQEAKLAKVKHEVQTVSKEIERITRALEEKFGKSLVVTQHEDRLVLTMLGQILFESGEAHLTRLGLDIMKQVGEVLVTLPNKSIQVEGHTDNNPIYGRLQEQYPSNWELSTARATTVLRYLIEQTGMNPKDFAATGYADIRPVASNDTQEGRAQNRRVEIVLYPERVLPDNKTLATLAR